MPTRADLVQPHPPAHRQGGGGVGGAGTARTLASGSDTCAHLLLAVGAGSLQDSSPCGHMMQGSLPATGRPRSSDISQQHWHPCRQLTSGSQNEVQMLWTESRERSRAWQTVPLEQGSTTPGFQCRGGKGVPTRTMAHWWPGLGSFGARDLVVSSSGEWLVVVPRLCMASRWCCLALL